MADEGTVVTRRLETLGRFSARHRRTVFLVALLVLVAAGGVAASTVQLDMGVGLYVDDDSATAQHWDLVESGYDRGNVVFVVVETDDVTDPETVRLVDRLDERYSGLDRITAARSLADVVRTGAGGEIPETERGVERAIERARGQNDAARTLVETIYPESGTTLLLLSYGDVAPPPDDGGRFDLVATKDAELVEGDVAGATDRAAVPAGTSVTVTGASIFETAAFELMLFDALTLFGGGFLVVFVVVYAVMRRRLDTGAHAFFSLAVGLAAVVVMLGAMGVLGYDFNAIMLSVLPVGLGLSVDYALQIQTRYAEERDAGQSPEDAAGIAARTTGRALVLAMGTTVVGFGSLVVSPVPPVRQFGVTAAVNVAAAMLLSVTLLVALLVRFDGRPGTGASRRDAATEGRLERGVGAVAGIARAHPVVILLLLVPAVAGGVAAYPHVDTTQEMLDYWPHDLEEREQFEETTETVPSPKTVYVLVETDDAYDPTTVREVATFQRQVADLPGVNAVGGPVTAVTTATGGEVPDSAARVRQLVDRGAQSPLSGAEPSSRHPDQLLLTLYVDDIEGTEIRTLVDDVDAAAAGPLADERVVVTGKPVVTRTIIENVTAGLERMTALSFGAAFLFLLVALRSPRDSLVLILAVPATAAALVLGAMYLLAIPWNPGTVSMASIALGVGVDYGLHIYERYRELCSSGHDPPAAMEEALRALSRPVFGSGLTTMAGFGVLVFSQFPVVRNFGKTLVLVVGFSMFASFVALPTVLLALDTTRRPHSMKLVLPVVGHRSAARDGAVATDPGPDAAVLCDGPLALSLDGDERVEYALTTGGGGLVHEHADGTDRYSSGGHAAAVTDRRVLFVAAGDADGTDATATVRYPSVRSAEASAGVRTTRFSVTTRGGETYHLWIGGRHDLDPVAGHVERVADHWTDVARHLDEATVSLATARDHLAAVDPETAIDVFDRVRERLSTARAVADEFADRDHPVHERVDAIERRLTAAAFDSWYARGESRRETAEAHRDGWEATGDRAVDRYGAVHDAYVAALDAYDRALDLAGDSGVRDADALEDRRDEVERRLSTLEDEPLARARAVCERAVETGDPSAAAEAWTEALDRLETALELAWADSAFEGDIDALRVGVEWAAASCVDANRGRADEAERVADSLDGETGRRRETYETAREHLQRARDLARTHRSGDLAAVEDALDRIAAKLADCDVRDSESGTTVGETRGPVPE